MRKLIRGATVLTVAAASVALPAAAWAGVDSAPPSCLVTRTWDNLVYAYVEVTNTCGGPERFRIEWENATDSQCITLSPGQKVVDDAVEPAWFSRLYNC